MDRKNQKEFSVSKIIAFDSGTTNSHNPKEDTCHWHSICYETPLRFNISLKKIFSRLGSLRVMKKYDESAIMQILQELETL